MDGWDGSALLQQVDKLAKKQRTDPVTKRLDEMIGLLDGWLDGEGAPDASTNTSDHERAHSLARLVERLEAGDPKGQAVREYHKELSALVTKLGKAIDKAMPARVDQALPDLEVNPRLVDQAIYTHLLAVGLFDVAEAVCEDAELGGGAAASSSQPELAPRLRELHEICGAMRERRPAAALEWVERHAPELRERGAGLRFLLHRLQFVELLRTDSTESALTYLRTHLSGAEVGGTAGDGEEAGGTAGARRANERPLDLKVAEPTVQLRLLAGAIAFANRLEGSPYADLLCPSLWSEVSGDHADGGARPCRRRRVRPSPRRRSIPP